ncbi:hypothetical protein K3495_g8487 [Podosphaera aphanis]|nr:hypothetical protein K3495_g8487 [Podosphaera aphanis]
MSAVVSKNLYELLGNDHDEDSDKEPEPPVKVIDKTPARTTKRNAPAEAPASKNSAAYEGRSGGNGRRSGNDGAFRDPNAGSANNRKKPVEAESTNPSGTQEGRGRGGRSGPRNFDRHSRGVGGDSEKQANHGWGANEGISELADEEAGKAQAENEKMAAIAAWGEATPYGQPDVEPEDTSISYADYIIQQEEKKAALAAEALKIRKPNEGATESGKWANAKPIVKDDAEDFVPGTTGKAKRDRERRQKQVIDIDQRFVDSSERGGRGGGFRGGRGRGGRGGRGDGPPRDSYGGYGKSDSGPNTSINTNDFSSFPSLGS